MISGGYVHRITFPLRVCASASLSSPYHLIYLLYQLDDVLRARLKTVGVSEYKFEMEAPAGRDAGNEWRLIDVGGSRSLVCAWHSVSNFLDVADVVLFSFVYIEMCVARDRAYFTRLIDINPFFISSSNLGPVLR
jgi:hypothetical protein